MGAVAPPARTIYYNLTTPGLWSYDDNSATWVQAPSIDSSGHLKTRIEVIRVIPGEDEDGVYDEIGFNVGVSTITWEAWDNGLYSKDNIPNKSETVATTTVTILDKSIPIVYFNNDITQNEDVFTAWSSETLKSELYVSEEFVEKLSFK